MTGRCPLPVTPLEGDAPPARVALEPPVVRVEKTKTAGWRVVYVPKSGRRVVRGRRLRQIDAMLLGAAHARVNHCQLEVAP